MRRKLVFIGVTLSVAAAALLPASGALAANSKQIYADYADNGRLDGHYSSSELRALLKDAWVQGYGNPTKLVRVKPAIHTAIRTQRGQAPVVLGAQVKQPLASVAEARTLPFTGFDVGLLLGGGAALLFVGGSLRRLTRERA